MSVSLKKLTWWINLKDTSDVPVFASSIKIGRGNKHTKGAIFQIWIGAELK